MLPFHPCRTSDMSGRGDVTASRVTDRAAAVIGPMGRVDTATVEGTVFPGIDHVIGSVLGSPPSGTSARTTLLTSNRLRNMRAFIVPSSWFPSSELSQE